MKRTVLFIPVLIFLFLSVSFEIFPQGKGLKWSATGDSYFRIEKNEIVKYTLPENKPEVFVSKKQLTPPESTAPLRISYYAFSADQQKLLLFTNTKRVWRLNTKGDYWVMDLPSGKLTRLGSTLPNSSLMFAKFSPDGKSVAYVSESNLYVEDLASSRISALTTDGSVTLINGTFDWVYEEEFACRDGFRWSPDGKSIAYWQVNAESIKKFFLINNTDSIYPRVIPIEYPKVGEKPSSCRVGVVTLAGARTTWMNIPGDPEQHYLVRMEFIPGTNRLLIQQLNRKQNLSRLYTADIATGNTTLIQEETDDAWVDIFQSGNTYSIDYTNNFSWLDEMRSILWVSEQDGWRHIYRVPLDGKPESLITAGRYDIIDIKYTDPREGYIYFMASPDNATQKYLYRTRLNGQGEPERLSQAALQGTHDYSISPNGKYASHTFSNHFTQPAREFITLAGHKPLVEKDGILSRLDTLRVKPTVEFFRVTTSDNVEMDGWMVKPENFDPSKKYPVLFFVYTEPGSCTVTDTWGIGQNRLYAGDMAKDGYICISIDNRGTPAPKGRVWRKSIYRKIGLLNIHDQAMAALEILKWGFVDTARIAVWGWSGGGTTTLNLMFQHPEIYKTGIAIAAISDQLTYDNIYQERYMGLPQENREDFVNGSPVTYAENLTGNLLIIHGTGDDNVHYQNAEMLINELVKHNKAFQVMPYPNRTHGISEGEGTFDHLSSLFTRYLKEHCPPGGK